MVDRFRGVHSFLSNFHPCIIFHQGVFYPTLEHAYQAQKTDDLNLRERFKTLATPGDAKRMGGEIPLRDGWDKMKDDVMWELLYIKFSNPVLRSQLLLTRPHELVEGNWHHDVYWGRCICETHKGQGENKLGQFLMKLREQLHNVNPQVYDFQL